MYVTSLDHPEYSDTYNRYDGYHHPVILHRDYNYHLGRFPSMNICKNFLKFADLELGKLIEERDCGKAGIYRRWDINCILDSQYFDDKQDIPDNAKPFTGLSNGYLVGCYLWKTNQTLHIRRPNPNNPDIYEPLSIEEHISFCRTNGYV